jgi:hypothetical protein
MCSSPKESGRGQFLAGLTLLAVFLLSTACELLDDCVTRPGSVTKLVADSPEVRRMLGDAAAQDERFLLARRKLTREQGIQLTGEMLNHPERYMAERDKLLDAMRRQPGVIVTGQQYFRLIEQTQARCGPGPTDTAIFWKVRVVTGPSKGAEGWACSRDVQPIGWFV